MMFKKNPGIEWEAVAGILAAIAAIILHLLHVVDEQVILPIVLALLGLLFINFLRHARNDEQTAEQVDHISRAVNRVQSTLKPPDVVLIGPRELRTANERFVRSMSGEAIWFNVCLSMYVPQSLFDALLRPALDNPRVSSIQFVLDESQKNLWQRSVWPKIADCPGHAKVRDPRWCNPGKTTSFILADTQLNGGAEALLSFWGEPFMAQTAEKDVPRFIFHVQRGSELLSHLVELERSCSCAEPS